MPNKKLVKEENQPSIKSLLPNCTENVECINVDQDCADIESNDNTSSINNTVRSCTNTDYSSPVPSTDQRLNNPEFKDIKEVKSAKKRKRKT